MFTELEGSKEVIEENTNIKIDEFTSLEELESVLSSILDSPIIKDLEQLAKAYKTLVSFDFKHFRIFDKGSKNNLKNIAEAIILKIILNKIYKIILLIIITI